MLTASIRKFLLGALLGLVVLGLIHFIPGLKASIIPGSVTNPTFSPADDDIANPSHFLGYGTTVSVPANSAPNGLLVWSAAHGTIQTRSASDLRIQIDGVDTADLLGGVPDGTTRVSVHGVGGGSGDAMVLPLAGMYFMKPGAGLAGNYDPTIAHTVRAVGGNTIAATPRVMVFAK